MGFNGNDNGNGRGRPLLPDPNTPALQHSTTSV